MGCIITTRCSKCECPQDYYSVKNRSHKNCRGGHTWITQEGSSAYLSFLPTTYCVDCGGTTGNCYHRWENYYC